MCLLSTGDGSFGDGLTGMGRVRAIDEVWVRRVGTCTNTPLRADHGIRKRLCMSACIARLKVVSCGRSLPRCLNVVIMN